MQLLVTGSEGFIGKNLVTRLKELDLSFDTFTKKNSLNQLKESIKKSDFIIHLAGENRSDNNDSFNKVNYELTKIICNEIRLAKKNIPIIYTSSTQATKDNFYGKSKLNAEIFINKLAEDIGIKSYIFRLPGIFGKWSKPNYNSVVATFCHNISQDLPIHIIDPEIEITLAYIDDVVEHFIKIIQGYEKDLNNVCEINPQYKIKLGDLADQLFKFKESRNSLITEKVGIGFIRKLYSTYLSFIKPNQFFYKINGHQDNRGIFAEFLKTPNCGQFSFFTAKPGITRGGHYHHSKTEKFLVLQGKAKFKFMHLISKETYEITIDSTELKIVETIPGWVHDITNISQDELIVMLWANEIFNEEKPDTYPYSL